ncbi:MAG: GNAT family N-acetyltransferase [Candidatus Liptonbacteria bacterium]|nr:GNAT family N-acetyltransferase [Candidatus Liptonbacteria bacterium]
MIKKPFLVKIRKAQKGDLDLLISLNGEFADLHARMDPMWRKADEEHTQVFRAYIRQALRKRNFLTLLAYANGEPIGYALGYLDEPELEDTILAPVHRRYGYIAATYVRSGFRKSGVGRRMFDALIRWFRRRGVRHIELMVDTRNRRGIRAWKRLGFREFMRRMELTL